jgi:predicted dienelactone hydrolase
LFSDPSRTNRYNIPTNSSFMVQFWFPAEPRKGVLPVAYLNSAIEATWYSYYSHVGLPANSTLFQRAVSHALSDITISTNQAPFPVVLFSHGYQCVRTMDTDVMENLASFGFITVAIDHADAWVSVFPSGQIVRGNAPDLPISTAQFSFNIQNRTRDVRFVLDELTRLNQQDELFGGRLDLEHVGIFGHSLGGGVVAEVCADDGRFKAGLSLDGAHTNVLALQISQPFLIASGTDANPVMQPFRADFRKFFDQLSQNAYWLELTNSEHFDFVESPWFATSPLPAKIRTATVLRAYTLSFFNKYLKGQDDHFLDGPPAAYPEVDAFLRK